MQKVIKRELIDTLQYMKIPHNRKFIDFRIYTLKMSPSLFAPCLSKGQGVAFLYSCYKWGGKILLYAKMRIQHMDLKHHSKVPILWRML